MLGFAALTMRRIGPIYCTARVDIAGVGRQVRCQHCDSQAHLLAMSIYLADDLSGTQTDQVQFAAFAANDSKVAPRCKHDTKAITARDAVQAFS